MRERLYLNNDWSFTEQYSDAFAAGEEQGIPVRLPHTCKETPLHYFDEELYQMVCGYRRILSVPRGAWRDRRITLTIEGAAHICEVFLNGEKIGEHRCGYTAFTMDVSERLHFGGKDVLVLKVDSRESANIPPFGFVIDYMTYGGVYRDVYLEAGSRDYLEDVFVKAKAHTLTSEIQVCAEGDAKNEAGGFAVRQWIRKKGEETYRLLGGQTVPSGAAHTAKEETLSRTLSLCFDVPEAKLWDVETPVLYEVKTELLKDETVVDALETTTGFRTAQFRKDGFYLNGKKLKIRGLNRHQSYPYVGYAMPRSMQEADADILKYELGVNAVRTSHYPQSHDFLNRCDELGLLVFTELPGWQHIGDETWKEQAVQNVRDMVRQYRNHTSVILWGVRINESKDDDTFYERTNRAARELDDTRQTAGVRAHKKSSLLEDVYTYNDFVHDGSAPGCIPKSKATPDMEKPYLVTEYNGHMYPTKAFDWEGKRTEHALRHARVLNDVAGEEDIAGSFGWCMADYNTHKDFGSGDRICYHGVLDMFRNPKTAAAVYAAQQEETPVLEISSTMDIGEHPACSREELYIFTNADSVRMYKNDRFLHEYKKEESAYSNLAHGPILIDDFIGDVLETEAKLPKAQAKSVKKVLNAAARYGAAKIPAKLYPTVLKLLLFYRMNLSQATDLYTSYVGDWGGSATTYRFEAVKNGRVVKTVEKEPMKQAVLHIRVSQTELMEGNSYDVAAVRIQAADEHANVLPFFNEPVFLETEGPIELIGPDVISLQGGMGGTFVKTTGEAGSARLTIRTLQTEKAVVEFTVKKELAQSKLKESETGKEA